MVQNELRNSRKKGQDLVMLIQPNVSLTTSRGQQKATTSPFRDSPLLVSQRVKETEGRSGGQGLWSGKTRPTVLRVLLVLQFSWLSPKRLIHIEKFNKNNPKKTPWLSPLCQKYPYHFSSNCLRGRFSFSITDSRRY